MSVAISVATYLIAATLSVSLLHLVGRRDRLLTPIFVFVSIEILAVWPPLVPSQGGILADIGPFPSVIAAVGLVAAVMTYVLLGGSQADATLGRSPQAQMSPAERRSTFVGLMILVLGLLILGFINFGGVPPLLTGGFSSLLDPTANADQASVIRETRRSLTKGQLIGESRAGQGVINQATSVGWRIAVVVAVLYWNWTRTRRSIQLLALVSVLAFIFMGSLGMKSPMVICAASGVAAFAVLQRMRSRQIIIATLIGVSFVLLIMPLSKGDSVGVSTVERSASLSQRVTDGNGKNNAQIVRLISSGGLELQRGGLFYERLAVMAPGARPENPFALRLTRLAYGAGSSTTGYASPSQYGLIYADFGPFGVIAGYAFTGGLLAMVWRLMTRIRAPFGAAIATEAAISLGYVSITGVHGLLSSVPVAALALLIASGPLGWSRVTRAISPSRTRPGPRGSKRRATNRELPLVSGPRRWTDRAESTPGRGADRIKLD